jgi:hypothetical protein
MRRDRSRRRSAPPVLAEELGELPAERLLESARKAASRVCSRADAREAAELAYHRLLLRKLDGRQPADDHAWVCRVATHAALAIGRHRKEFEKADGFWSNLEARPLEAFPHRAGLAAGRRLRLTAMLDRGLAKLTALQDKVIRGLLAGRSLKALARQLGRPPAGLRRAREAAIPKLRDAFVGARHLQ